MFIDSLLKVAAAQAYTAAAVSANSIDLGAAQGLNSPPIRQVGTGEPDGFGFNVNVAASATTVLLEIISATDAALTAGIVVEASRQVTGAQAALGALFFLGLPPGSPTSRFIGTRVTPAGGAATVTMSSWFTTQSMFSLLAQAYGKNYVI
jgi:hypothetical protein